MSIFGSALSQPQQGSTGLFGSLGPNTGTQNQQTGGLFGAQNNQQNNQQSGQTGGNLFGGLGQNQQNQNPQMGGSIFGQNNQQNQTQQGGALFGGLGQNNNQQNGNQQGGGLFGGLGQNNQQGGSVFGQPQQQNQTQSGLFGGSIQQQQQPGGLFSQSQQPSAQSQQGQLNGTLWTPNSGINPREKSVPDQIKVVKDKWDVGSPECAFKYYFYNKVDEHMAPYYRPSPNEDPKAWEEALSKKPGPGFIPVLCTGFQQMGERIKIQQRNLAEFNARLHMINDALSKILQDHDTKYSIRAMDAKRKHVVLKNRCLALATKVQILRNRGYALDGDEEDLQGKLQTLERSVCDPGLGARAEEIWARMIRVQERARALKIELDRSASESNDVLDEETSKRAKKILEDYQTQLAHLKKEMDSIHAEYIEWEKEQGPPSKKPAVR